MSHIKPSDDQSHTATAKHHALQVALQTLRERCQFFQTRITTLEEEISILRASQTKPSVASGPVQFCENIALSPGQNEVEMLRESVAELTYQKTQLAEHISMVAAENRQLWRRLSQIVKDVPPAFADGDDNLPHQCEQHRRPSSTNNQPGQNLIRSRTFTKNAPNPKLRERMQRDGSFEDELLNLEDISLLNTCGFLGTVGRDLLQLGVVGKQDDEQLQAALEANPGIRRCIEGLTDIRSEVMEQERVMRDIFNSMKLKTGSLCKSCKNLQFTDKKKLSQDVKVEVPEKELLHMNEQAASNTSSANGSDKQIDDRDDPLLTTSSSNSKGDAPIDLLLQEKIHSNRDVERICPMCGKPYGQETIFDEFQQHVESHFLDDSEMGDISFDRTYEYISHTVGNF